MRNIIFPLLLLTVSHILCAQTEQKDSLNLANKKDSAEKARMDSLKFERLFSTALYPLIKNSKWSGVIPVANIEENPDPSMKYKLVMEVTGWNKDSASHKEINWALAEVGRVINLHIAAGIPKENLNSVLVIHGAALNAVLNDEAYRKKFKTDNPNLALLKQFDSLGIKLIVCGQAMAFFGFKKEELIPEVRTAISAKVALSTYQLKGYVLYEMKDEN
ncbi:MAG TPA: DsrE family protein [Puia sp.]|nr:DsrE family protein [Puia sp.]